MASFSWRISPRTSTVIFFDRSPFATAIVTSAMLRTCAVRLLAIELTLSVNSFHTPVTSMTCAWPPSLPSVPTSRATRVTSEVNTPSCLIMVLTMVAACRNSPFSGRPSTSRRTVCSRSPLATAATTRVTSVVGHNRSSIRALTESSISPQAPLETPSFMRWRVRPSRPTSCPTRSSCCAMRWFEAAISLKTSAIFSRMPACSPVMRTEKVAGADRLQRRQQLVFKGGAAVPGRYRVLCQMSRCGGAVHARFADDVAACHGSHPRGSLLTPLAPVSGGRCYGTSRACHAATSRLNNVLDL